MSAIDDFYALTAPLVRGREKDTVKEALDAFVLKYGDECLLTYKENPFLLVTECGLPFTATRIKEGIYSYKKSRIMIPTFAMHLKAIYALIYDLLRDNEQKGNSCEDVSYLWMKVRHFYPWMTMKNLKCYLYKFRDTFDYDMENKVVGFAFRKKQEKFILNKISPLYYSSFDTSDYADDDSLIEEQNEAVKTVLSRGLSILTGGPGTGKTTVIRSLLRYYREKHPDADIKLLAPTGKAARRLAESITGFGRTSTIHSLVFSMKQRGVSENSENIDLMIIDEASMIETDIFYDLLRYIGIKQLILVGDVDQLPSVGCGNILSDMVDMGFPVARLTINHRSSGNIISNAQKVKDRDTDLTFGNGFDIIEARDKDIEDIAISLRHDERTMILSPYRNMAQSVNMKIHESIFADREYRLGDRVMFLKNRRSKGYMNGDMGEIVGFDDHAMVVKLDDLYGSTVIITDRYIDDITYGYSMTVHKSQGSEYENVVIMIPEGTGYLFSRKLLYTAITRAKRSVTIIGSKKELINIITSSNEDIRKTYINLDIKTREPDATLTLAA